MNTRKIISAVLAVVMLVCSLPFVYAADSIYAYGISEISKHGNVKMNITQSQLLTFFEHGDIVTVSFGNVNVDLPLCSAYSDIDSGEAAVIAVPGSEEGASLTVNMGSFASVYGIAEKITNPDKSYDWIYNDGMSVDMTFSVSMKEKGGYLEEYTLRSLSYTDEREDYPHLSDEEFANFRCVTVGNLKQGVLYRSATPVEPIHNRNVYADIASKNAGVNVFINLADSEEELASYEGYFNTYYSTVKHIAADAGVDVISPENKSKYADAFRFIAENKGVYDVHCREGKDRTGFFIAVLECLMGATLDEVITDYMITYYNYYGIKKGDRAYGIISEGNLKKTLKNVFGEDIETADLSVKAEQYLKEIGLTDNEISAVRQNLSPEKRSSFFDFIANIINSIINFIKSIFVIGTSVC